MLDEDLRNIAGVADAGAKLDLEHSERGITRKLKLSTDMKAYDKACAMQLKVHNRFFMIAIFPLCLCRTGGGRKSRVLSWQARFSSV